MSNFLKENQKKREETVEINRDKVSVKEIAIVGSVSGLVTLFLLRIIFFQTS